MWEAPSAEAQEGLGTVVCVGSELESMASAGPVRRVIRKDVELVYRAAVELAGRDEIEEGLAGGARASTRRSVAHGPNRAAAMWSW